MLHARHFTPCGRLPHLDPWGGLPSDPETSQRPSGLKAMASAAFANRATSRPVAASNKWNTPLLNSALLAVATQCPSGLKAALAARPAGAVQTGSPPNFSQIAAV